MRYLVFPLIALTLLTGCSVDSISFKLTDFEYQKTDEGFKVKTNNWTDILFNNPQLLPGEAPPPGMTYYNYTPGNPGVRNVSKNGTKELIAEVENNTVTLALQ